MSNSSNTVLQGWMPESDGRGTWSILWSCLSTTFICLWVAFHPNVPAATDNQWQIMCHRLQWVALGALAPEWIAFTACEQWSHARHCRNRLQTLGYKCSLMQAFHVVMGGFYIVSQDKQKTYALRWDRLYQLLKDGHIELPLKEESNSSEWLLSDRDIQDRSKADELAKAVAITHVLWFAVQCIARTAKGLPISLLEVTTAGYVYCAAMCYCLWWSKPYNVQIATKLEVKSELPWNKLTEGLSDRVPATLGQIGPEFAPGSFSSNIGWPISICALVAGFGGIHVAAWDFTFPSAPEEVCWKVAAIISVAWSGFLGFIMFFIDFCEEWLERYAEIWLPFFAVSYFIARLYLLVGAFLSLRASPAGIYDASIVANFVF